MNQIKKYFVLTIFSLGLFFVSCSSSTDGPRDTSPTSYYSDNFGYFYGTVNNESVSLENTWDYSNIRGFLKISTPDVTLPEDQWLTKYSTSLIFKNGVVLSMLIAPLKEGIHNVKGFDYSETRTVIHCVDSEENLPGYIAMKAPFVIDITKLTYRPEYTTPYVEGTLNGVLYNRNNLNDSIVIRDARFGAHGL